MHPILSALSNSTMAYGTCRTLENICFCEQLILNVAV